MKKLIRGAIIGLVACTIGLAGMAQAAQEQNALEIYAPHAAPTI